MVLRSTLIACALVFGWACFGQDLSGEVRIQCEACTLMGTTAHPSIDISGEYSFRITVPKGDMVPIRVTQRKDKDPDTMSVDFVSEGSVNMMAVTGGKEFMVLTIANVTK